MFFIVKVWQVSNITLKSSYRRFSIKNLSIINIHRKTPVLESLSHKVAGLQACHFIKKRFQHSCFQWILRIFLENTYLRGHLWTTASGLYLFKLERNNNWKTEIFVFRDTFRDSNEYASVKTKQNPCVFSFISQKIRTAISADLFLNSILSSHYCLAVRH